MSTYNLIEYRDYSETSGSLWQYYRDKPALKANDEIVDFHANKNNSASFKFKKQIKGETGDNDTKNVKITVPLKYLCNFWRTLEMSLISCETSRQLK